MYCRQEKKLSFDPAKVLFFGYGYTFFPATIFQPMSQWRSPG
jgi:hypothetical protein